MCVRVCVYVCVRVCVCGTNVCFEPESPACGAVWMLIGCCRHGESERRPPPLAHTHSSHLRHAGRCILLLPPCCYHGTEIKGDDGGDMRHEDEEEDEERTGGGVSSPTAAGSGL